MFILRIVLICLSLFLVMPVTNAKNFKCVLIPFTDQTPYKKIGTNELYSELVTFNLLESGMVDTGEIIALDSNDKSILYEANYNYKKMMTSSIENNDFNAIFDDILVDEKTAPNVIQAKRGQFVTPEVIAEIANKYGAEYVIQGNVLRIGNDRASMDNEQKIANLTSGAIKLLLGVDLGGVDVSKYGISLTCDLKLIRAKDGMVVWELWCPTFNGRPGMSLDNVKIGAKNADSEMFYQTVEQEAQILTSSLISYLNKM